MERALSTAGIVTECFGFHLLIFITRPIITLPLDFFHIAFSNIAASIHRAGRGIRYSYLLPRSTYYPLPSLPYHCEDSHAASHSLWELLATAHPPPALKPTLPT